MISMVFKVIECNIDLETAAPEFFSPSNTNLDECGSIGKDPMKLSLEDVGKMKNVYHVSHIFYTITLYTDYSCR
jgi:hypothetical protein